MKTAKQILEESLVIDCHLDIGFDLELKHERGRTNVLVEDYLESLRAGHVDTVFAAVYADAKYLPEQGIRRIMDEISLIYQEVDASNGAFVIVKNADDILKAKENNQIGLLLTIEGIEPLGGDIIILRSLYALGIRVAGICWSRSGWAADGCRFVPLGEYEGYGLTEAGKEFVAYAEELGIILDVSHLNKKGFWDLVDATKNPFMATHSNTYVNSPVSRNLEDDQIRIIAERGGVIGANGANFIVNFNSPQDASMSDMADHMLHEKEIGSSSVLAIGLDQAERFGTESSALTGQAVFDVMPTHDKLLGFVEVLMEKGFSEQEIKGALGENVLNLLRRVVH